jgi:hypothetical protein
MSSNSPDSSLSFGRSLSKNNVRPCLTCPHRLSDFSKHEATPESESEPEEMKTDTITAEEPRTTEITMAGNPAEASSAAVSALATAVVSRAKPTTAIAQSIDFPDHNRGENLGEKASTQFPTSRKQIDLHTDLPLKLRLSVPRRRSRRASQYPRDPLLAGHQGRPSPYQNLHPELRIQNSASEARCGCQAGGGAQSGEVAETTRKVHSIEDMALGEI